MLSKSYQTGFEIWEAPIVTFLFVQDQGQIQGHREVKYYQEIHIVFVEFAFSLNMLLLQSNDDDQCFLEHQYDFIQYTLIPPIVNLSYGFLYPEAFVSEMI